MRTISLIVLLLLIEVAAMAQPEVVKGPDGKKYTRILLNGSVYSKYDIVFIGDGYTASEQNLFNEKVNEVIAELRSATPYSTKMTAFNIWRVNVVSKESGISDPKTHTLRNTALSCRFGDENKEEAERCVTTDDRATCYLVADMAPEHDAVVILANSSKDGGCASDLVFVATGGDFKKVITHELGHKVGELGDEYTCYICKDPTDDGRVYSDGEPSSPNLTTNIKAGELKWQKFITTGARIPTTSDIPVGVVGVVEGGGYYPKHIYRPQFHCHMRELERPFCKVCNDHLSSRLDLYNSNIKRLKQNMLVKNSDLIKVPYCFDCSYENPLATTKLILPNSAAPLGSIEILDEDMNIVAKSTVSNNTVQFDQNAEKEYFIHIRSATDAISNEMETPSLNVKAALYRNKKSQKIK